MTCYHPITGWRDANGDGPVNRRPLVFTIKKGMPSTEMQIPCGQCDGCRLDRSKVWAARCMHEASLHDDNCFITLTYAVDPGSLVPENFVKFMKRLRKKYGKMRYYQCGEYGAKFSRPHHHACLFGFDFPDKFIWSTKSGVKLYRSESLDKIWGLGFATIGSVNYKTAAYTARYILKKQVGSQAGNYYKDLQPEYTTMSRRPGIAYDWFTKYKNDVLAIDGIIVNGRKVKSPRYYDKLYDITNPQEMERIKILRRDNVDLSQCTPERLSAREKCLRGSISRLTRSMEV